MSSKQKKYKDMQCGLIFREYIKFELLFVEKLRARQKILSLEKEEEVKEGENKDTEKEDDEEEKRKENVEKKNKIKDADKVEDTILNFGLVNLVLEVQN